MMILLTSLVPVGVFLGFDIYLMATCGEEDYYQDVYSDGDSTGVSDDCGGLFSFSPSFFLLLFAILFVTEFEYFFLINIFFSFSVMFLHCETVIIFFLFLFAGLPNNFFQKNILVSPKKI